MAKYLFMARYFLWLGNILWPYIEGGEKVSTSIITTATSFGFKSSSEAETSRAVSFAYRLIPIPSLKSIVPSCSLVAWLFRLDCGPRPNWLLWFSLNWPVKTTLLTIWLKGVKNWVYADVRLSMTSWCETIYLSSWWFWDDVYKENRI